MTWDENLLQFQKKYGGSLLGSIYPYQPAGLLHTRFRGAELTFYPSMVSSGNAAPTLWAAAAVPAELERPFSLSVKHRNKLIPQGLLADLELCSTGRTELDGVLFTESDDPEFAKKVFLSSELSDLLTRAEALSVPHPSGGWIEYPSCGTGPHRLAAGAGRPADGTRYSLRPAG